MNVLRLSTWLYLALIAAVGWGMFQVKYQVAQLDDELSRVNRSIDADRDKIRVLGAEWSYLTQLPRLDQLRQRYLTLAPITRAQLGSLDQVPFRAGETAAPVAAAAPAVGVVPAPPHRPTVALPGGADLVSAKPGASR
jgi:hypothetical protein